MRCTEFDSNTSLRSLFVTEELAPFANALPEASSKAGRVDATLAYLSEKRLRDGQGTLPLFATALRDRYDDSDALWGELETLLHALLEAVGNRKKNQPRPKVGSTEAADGAIDVAVQDIPSGAYTDLTEAFARGEICAFVGAGLSVGASLPGWYDLIGELATRLNRPMPPKEWATADTLIDIAQTYINRRGLFDFIAFLNDRLDTTGKRPSAVHLALARLPIRVVFTANYDDLLEQAYRAVGKRVMTIVQDNDIPFMRRDPASVNIVKLYGDLDRPDSIVLAREQYEDFFLKRQQIIKLLEVHLGSDTMVYLGWSHSDPHFNLVFGEMLARFGKLMRSGYAAMFDITDDQRLDLERKHIRIVDFPAADDRTAQLASWLDSLISIESPSIPRQSVTRAEDGLELPRQMTSLAQVTILLEGDLAAFSGLRRDQFAATLAQVIGINASQVRVLQVAAGSIVVILEMPVDAAQKLLAMFLQNHGALKVLGITQVTLVEDARDKVGRGSGQNDRLLSKPTARIPGQDTLQERSLTRAGATPTLSELPDIELLVTLSPDQRILSYVLHSPGDDYHYRQVGSVHLTVSPRELLQRVFDRFSTLARQSSRDRSPEQTRRVERELADVGSNLYAELFPPELKLEYRKLRQKHADGNLLITSNEPSIPWEMIKPVEFDADGQVIYDDPPLCEMFKLSRWMSGRAAPSRLTLRRAVLIQPAGNLKATSAEAQFFAGLSAAAPGIVADAPLQNVDSVLDAFRTGTTQLYHFACHGNFDLTDPNESKLRLADGFLSPNQIVGDRQSGLRRAKPLVFLNACHSGELGRGLTRLGGWAERLIDAGASAFVGSLWEINDEMAAQFALEFYDRILGLKGYTIVPLAEAFREARRAIRAADPANPTWLAYVLYGNPHAYLSP